MSAGETVTEFAARAEPWIAANLPSADEAPADPFDLQRLLYDAGFAGIAFPQAYGGAGLTLDHQKAFYDLAVRLGRQVPGSSALMVSVGMIGPTILERGSDAARARFLPRLLRGDDVWIQLLSEPRGGSDMAGATTSLTRDGDTWVLSGSKMWSTGAHTADYGLCLCRSDWTVPKHRGLAMVAVPLKDTPGVTIEQTRTADGRLGEFCQEFFDEVALAHDHVVGDPGDGWSVAQSLLVHERNAVANIGFGYLDGAASDGSDDASVNVDDLIRALHATGRAANAALRSMIVDAFVGESLLPMTSDRVMRGMKVGTHEGQWGSLLKLQGAVAHLDRQRAKLAVHGVDGVAWDGADVAFDNPGTEWLGARGNTLAGGSNEIQRNIISERLLGLPREPSVDRDVPFSDVVRNQRGDP